VSVVTAVTVPRARVTTGKIYPVGEFEDDYVRHHVLMWAEAVVRQVDRVRQQRKKDGADFHSYDQELGAPMTYEVRRNFRTTQAEEHTLIWAARQLEKWTQRWAIERDRTPADPDPVLADVRNAMEHLYEAAFDEHAVAVPGPFGSNRSLRKLPYGSVPRGVGNRLAGRLAVDDLEERALAMVNKVETEIFDQEEGYIEQSLTDEMRGK
jgi:hypothetical protein